MKKRAILGLAVAVILLVSLVVGLYLSSSRGGAASTSSSLQSSTSSASGASSSTSSTSSNPLSAFGGKTSTVSVGAAPYGVAYDPVNEDTFVAVSDANGVAVIDNESRVVTTIPLGGAADFLAYDPADSFLYVALVGNNSVSVINTTRDAVVASVPVPTSSGWLAYDAASETVYSVNRESNTVSVLANTTLVKTISLTGLPFAIAYDPSDGDMYVSSNIGTVFVLNGRTATQVGSVQVGGASSTLLGIAYNPGDQRIYVTSYGDDEVYAINGTQAVGSFKGFNNPTGISFGTSNSEMFVVNSGNDTVSALWNGRASTVQVGSDPREVLFEPATAMILVTNYGGSTVSIIGT